MTVKKEAVAGVERGEAAPLSLPAELEAVNRLSKTPLTEEEVYLFRVRLCDNQVDRDEEYFSREALEQLAPLFVGKSGIFDHSWSAKHQTARIYRTEVVTEPGVVPESGEVRCYLKGYAYMLRSEGNADLIAEIEAGIKKEVSVSCAVAKRLCSICGQELGSPSCSHVKGQVYDGRRCVAGLFDPTDAYEWSFVAVPAQRQAGVMKGAKEQEAELSALLGLKEAAGATLEAVKKLQKEAALGRRYLDALREEVIALGLLAQCGMERADLTPIVQKLEEPELLRLKAAYEESLRGRLPLKTQLSYGEQAEEKGTEDSVFRI